MHSLEAFGQSVLIGVIVIIASSMLRFGTETLYHLIYPGSQSPSTIVFPYIELCALYIVAHGLALAAGKLVSNPAYTFGEIAVGKLTLRCTGGYIKGYHFRIGYAVFIAFKAFIFPFIFGCTGEESSTNIYLTFALTLLEFFWLILCQPFDGARIEFGSAS